MNIESDRPMEGEKLVKPRKNKTLPDEQVADLLRRSKKPVLLAVNKVDNGDRMLNP